MGAYAARRYVLDNPDTHQVEGMVTLAAPFLGGPKLLSVFETGDSFRP